MTSFVITTVSSLQPDYTQITVALLVEQVTLLRAAGNITMINAIPSVDVGNLETVSPSANNLWINGLFFASLPMGQAFDSCSLSGARLNYEAERYDFR